ncbi:DUF6207 family protein [Streptomyces sp. NPDC058305]|uniref:DUF6207 family protein n=1 Tax=Streptomyces sp. NPDC058305 TaxID=3346438 RepID=UPI0036EF8E4A
MAGVSERTAGSEAHSRPLAAADDATAFAIQQLLAERCATATSTTSPTHAVLDVYKGTRCCGGGRSLRRISDRPSCRR